MSSSAAAANAAKNALNAVGAAFAPIGRWAQRCQDNHKQEQIVFASLGLWAVVIGAFALPGGKKDAKTQPKATQKTAASH
eukprot:ANDGO_05913.mRNA.1 hypothetical protein